jgi:hypothetical protein
MGKVQADIYVTVARSTGSTAMSGIKPVMTIDFNRAV